MRWVVRPVLCGAVLAAALETPLIVRRDAVAHAVVVAIALAAVALAYRPGKRRHAESRRGRGRRQPAFAVAVAVIIGVAYPLWFASVRESQSLAEQSHLRARLVVLQVAVLDWSGQHGGALPESLAALAAGRDDLLAVLTEDPRRQQLLRATASTDASVPGAAGGFDALTDFVYRPVGGPTPGDALIVSKQSLRNGERLVLTRGLDIVQRAEPAP